MPAQKQELLGMITDKVQYPTCFQATAFYEMICRDPFSLFNIPTDSYLRTY